MTEQQARREAYLDVVKDLDNYLTVLNKNLPHPAIMSRRDAVWTNSMLQVIKELKNHVLDKAAKVK